MEHPLLRYLASVLAGTADERSKLGERSELGGGGGGGGEVELEAADELEAASRLAADELAVAREIGVPADPLEGGRGVVDLGALR